MKKIVQCVLISVSSLLATFSFGANSSPVGYWQTIDDITGQPKALVEITETNNVLNGKILKLYPREGMETNPVCTACQGDKHNQPIVGMQILENLKPSTDDHDSWVNGEILDPKNGKTYHCRINLVDEGAKLQVRGYIGLPLLGRTQTWVRQSSPNA